MRPAPGARSVNYACSRLDRGLSPRVRSGAGGAGAGPVPGTPRTGRSGLARDPAPGAAAVSRSGHGDHGDRPALAGGPIRGRRGRVRHWKDVDLPGRGVHARPGPGIHVSDHGAAPARREVVPGGDPNAPRCPRVRGRRVPERRGLERLHGRQRSAAPGWAHRSRGTPNDAQRHAPGQESPIGQIPLGGTGAGAVAVRRLARAPSSATSGGMPTGRPGVAGSTEAS
jgi:hypothetical protein